MGNLENYERERLRMARTLGLRRDASWDEIYLRFKRKWRFFPWNAAKITLISLLISALAFLLPISWIIKSVLFALLFLLIWFFLLFVFGAALEDQYWSNLHAVPFIDRGKKDGFFS